MKLTKSIIKRSQSSVRMKIGNKDEAKTIVQDLMDGNFDSRYTLGNTIDYQRSNERFKTEAYRKYSFLSFKNTRLCAGWIVFVYPFKDYSSVSSALRKFDGGSTTTIKHHVKKHEFD